VTPVSGVRAPTVFRTAGVHVLILVLIEESPGR
jgi:hypothetical protein